MLSGLTICIHSDLPDLLGEEVWAPRSDPIGLT